MEELETKKYAGIDLSRTSVQFSIYREGQEEMTEESFPLSEEEQKEYIESGMRQVERYMETGSLSMELSKGKILVFYCDRGGASLKVAKELAVKGYRTRSVIGGFHAYRGRNLVISG